MLVLNPRGEELLKVMGRYKRYFDVGICNFQLVFCGGDGKE